MTESFLYSSLFGPAIKDSIYTSAIQSLASLSLSAWASSAIGSDDHSEVSSNTIKHAPVQCDSAVRSITVKDSAFVITFDSVAPEISQVKADLRVCTNATQSQVENSPDDLEYVTLQSQLFQPGFGQKFSINIDLAETLIQYGIQKSVKKPIRKPSKPARISIPFSPFSTAFPASPLPAAFPSSPRLQRWFLRTPPATPTTGLNTPQSPRFSFRRGPLTPSAQQTSFEIPSRENVQDSSHLQVPSSPANFAVEPTSPILPNTESPETYLIFLITFSTVFSPNSTAISTAFSGNNLSQSRLSTSSADCPNIYTSTFTVTPPSQAEENKSWAARVLSRKCTVNNLTWDLQEIYGLPASKPVVVTAPSSPPTLSSTPNPIIDITHNYPPSTSSNNISSSEDHVEITPECSICLASARTVMLLPCRHLVACKDCATRMNDYGEGITNGHAWDDPVGSPGENTNVNNSETNNNGSTGLANAEQGRGRRRKAKGWFCPICRVGYTALLAIDIPVEKCGSNHEKVTEKDEDNFFK